MISGILDISDSNRLHIRVLEREKQGNGGGTSLVKKQKIYYGWIMVIVAAIGVFFSGPGQTYSNSTFIDYLIADFGWSRTEVSSIYSIATFFAGLIMIVVGRFIDRFGQRLMMVGVGVLFAIALFYNSLVTTLPMLFLGFFLIRLLGQGSMSLIPTTLVAQWFVKKRGVAFSLMSLGGFISSAMFPIINIWLIQSYSWQVAWRFWGVMLLVVFVPIAFFFVRNRPEDIGLVPDGHAEGPKFNLKASMEIAEVDWTLKEAMHTRTFWFVLFCVGVPAMVNTGITFHITSIFGSQGLSVQMAATILSMMAFVGIPMSFLSGLILDKIKTNVALMIIFGLEVILLLLLTVMTTNVLAILFGFLWGVAGGIERISLKAIWPNYFGRRYIGSINGVSSTVMVLGSSLGPLPFGAGFDVFGSYQPILLGMIVFPVIAFILSVLAKKPEKTINV